MNTSQKGDFACLRFDALCIKAGIPVLVPRQELRYDRAIEINGVFQRIQIKYSEAEANNSGDAFYVNLRTQRNGKQTKASYDAKEIDALVVYLAKSDKFYWLNKECFVGKTSLSLRPENLTEFNPL